MSYTKTDMRAIFKRGISLGHAMGAEDVESEQAMNEVADQFFENILSAIRDDKTKVKAFDANKAVEEWKRTKKGQPPIPGMYKE